MGVKEGNELNGKPLTPPHTPHHVLTVVLGIEPRVSGLLSKCTATEETYPGTECVNAESELYIHFTVMKYRSQFTLGYF